MKKLWIVGALLLLASPVAAGDWKISSQSEGAIIEGTSEDGRAALRVTCKRGTTELNLLFASGLSPTHVSSRIDGGKRMLDESNGAGPGFTLLKPYSYALLVSLMSGKRLEVTGFILNGTGRSEPAVFDLAGLGRAVQANSYPCLLGPAPPKI